VSEGKYTSFGENTLGEEIDANNDEMDDENDDADEGDDE